MTAKDMRADPSMKGAPGRSGTKRGRSDRVNSEKSVAKNTGPMPVAMACAPKSAPCTAPCSDSAALRLLMLQAHRRH